MKEHVLYLTIPASRSHKRISTETDIVINRSILANNLFVDTVKFFLRTECLCGKMAQPISIREM